jgi:replicative DNA helicase
MRNREAELAVIGMAINDIVCAASLAAAPAELFASKDTAALHRGIIRLSAKGSVDMITLADEVRCDLDDPYSLIADCVSKGFAPSMYGQYEAMLGQCLKRRTLANLAQLMAADANNPAADPDALSAQVIDALRGADSGPVSVSLADALVDFIDDLGRGSDARCMMGLPDVDRILGGLRGGQYIAIAARPGVGKSAFALAAAVNIARTRGPVLMASLEMSPKEIAARCVAAASGVDGDRINSGDLDEEAYALLTACYPDLSRIPLRITDRARTPLKIRREAVRMKSRGGLSAIVVDYIGLMASDNRTSSRYELVTAVSVELKALAAELDVPILVLTQLNRSSEGGKDGKLSKRPPQMSEARDSGSVEQDANAFLILYDPPPPDQDRPGDPAWESWCACDRNGWEQLTVIVEKNRAGKKGVAFVGFDKAHMRFHCLDLRREADDQIYRGR